MASSRIKGITIDIGGNTQKLQDALKGVDKQIYGLNADLKDLNKALKLDPNNTELLAQKQDVLARNIKASTDRLNALKEAQKQLGSYNSLTEEQKAQYNALSGEIAKTEKALKDMNNELKGTAKIDLSALKTGLAKVGDIALDVGKKLAQVTTAISGALTGVVSLGVKSYASLEQNLGGIETLFGDSADKVVENARKAFKTAGVSANEYMQGVTSFSASLLQSLGGNTDKAADIADMAFRDMSDNANKFGTDMSSIQSAYQGFAKQNYTLLDNLKLGYGGTKTEMERLLKDASKISGVKYDIKNLSDVYEAIHVIQGELKVTGTTAKESASTISGSVQTMKSAFDNFINGSGGAEDLIESVNNVLTNVSNAVIKIAPSILSGIPKLISSLLPQIGQMIVNLAPQLFQSVSQMITQILDMVKGDTTGLQNTISSLVESIVTFFTENLPKIIEIALTILVTLTESIANNLDTIVPAIVDCVITIVNTLIDNLDMIIDAGIKLIIALAESITDPKTLKKLIDAVPKIITTIVTTLVKNFPKIVSAGVQIIGSLATGLYNAFSMIRDKAFELLNNFKDWLLEGLWKIKDVGKELISGLWSGLTEKWDSLKNSVKNFGEGVVNKFKNVFGIASPSKVFKKVIGTNLALGISEGFTEEMNKVSTDMTKSIPVDDLIGEYDTAMRSLTRGINSSVNPTINPSITYEQNYSMMSKAMKEALNDMVVDLDDREVGRFVSKTITNEVYGR